MCGTFRSAAAALDVDDDVAALIIEVAWAAGLLATTGEVGDEWLPTPAYDAWRVASTASRWVALAAAWFGTPHVPSLVGTTDTSGGRVNPLTADVERIVASDIRRWVLDDLAAMPAGTAVATPSMVTVTSGAGRGAVDACGTTWFGGRCTRRLRLGWSPAVP